MHKVWQKVVVLLAVVTIVGHSFVPHQHHQETNARHHDVYHSEHAKKVHHGDHEHSTQDHHGIFSFAQLDENFLPKFGKITFDISIIYLLIPTLTVQLDKLNEKTKTHFGYYREYPPPDNYSFNLFSRPPPVTCTE
jgi:hypothetical protein